VAERERLHIDLDLAATPERVAQASRILADLLASAAPDLPADSVTMVVDNLKMRSTLRSQNDAGDAAIAALRRVVESIRYLSEQKPDEHGHRALPERPTAEMALLAGEVADNANKLRKLQAQVRLPRRRKPLAIVDNRFVASSKEVAATITTAAGIAYGTTTVYSEVLRAGRLTSGGTVGVRLFLDGSPRDIAIEAGFPSAPFFDAARDGGMRRITVAAAWLHDGSGAMRIVPRETRAREIDADWRAASGTEVLEMLMPFSRDMAEHIIGKEKAD
jgi:hypothetical protein